MRWIYTWMHSICTYIDVLNYWRTVLILRGHPRTRRSSEILDPCRLEVATHEYMRPTIQR